MAEWSLGINKYTGVRRRSGVWRSIGTQAVGKTDCRKDKKEKVE